MRYCRGSQLDVDLLSIVGNAIVQCHLRDDCITSQRVKPLRRLTLPVSWKSGLKSTKRNDKQDSWGLFLDQHFPLTQLSFKNQPNVPRLGDSFRCPESWNPDDSIDIFVLDVLRRYEHWQLVYPKIFWLNISFFLGPFTTGIRKDTPTNNGVTVLH